MKTTHEEADVIIPQVQKAMDGSYRNVKVICDDIDLSSATALPSKNEFVK